MALHNIGEIEISLNSHNIGGVSLKSVLVTPISIEFRSFTKVQKFVGNL